MPVDPSIILQANNQGPDMGRVFTLAAAMQQMQVQRQKIAAQNTLRSIFSNPANFDTGGTLKPEAQQQVMAADPATGMKMQSQKLQEDVYKTDLFGKKLGMVDSAWGKAQEAYDQAKKSGATEEASRDAGQRELDTNLSELDKGGVFSEQEREHFVRKYDPLARGRLAANYQTWKDKNQSQALKEREVTARESTAASAAKRADAYDALAAGGGKGAWQILTDPTKKDAAGNPTQYRYNASTTEATTLDGKPYSPGGASKISSGATGATMSDDAVDLIADQVLAGNRMATTGLARSAANIAKVNEAIARKAKEQGMSGADIARKQAEFSGMMSGERAIGTRSANMEMAANEVKYMAPLALKASEKVDRSKFPKFNEILLSAEKGTGDEDVVRFGLAANSLIYMYAKFLNPNGIPTDADKAKATEILSTAWTKGQFKTAVDQIQQEIKAGETGVSGAKKNLGESLPGTTKPKASGKPPTITSSDAYDKLPDGADYIGPDGKPYVKGGRK